VLLIQITGVSRGVKELRKRAKSNYLLRKTIS